MCPSSALGIHSILCPAKSDRSLTWCLTAGDDAGKVFVASRATDGMFIVEGDPLCCGGGAAVSAVAWAPSAHALLPPAGPDAGDVSSGIRPLVAVGSEDGTVVVYLTRSAR